MYAGKKTHEELSPNHNYITRHVKECQLMSKLHHPNITLFMGVCSLPGHPLPVLVLEKLDGSLQELLDTVPNIPLVLKLSILRDVSKGLLYLHEHMLQIIHANLTATNVLLTPYFVAKISDFGSSLAMNSDQLTKYPGTVVYMPPEALVESPHYNSSLDIFSFGVLTLYVGLQVTVQLAR